MLERVRGQGAEALTGLPWARILYLTNCTMALLVIAIYLFGFRMPVISERLTLIGVPAPLALALDYGVLVLFWMLIESLGYVEHTPALQHLYPNRGLRWYDLGLGVLAVLVLWWARRAGFATTALWLLGGLTLANSIISALQFRYQYDPETLAAGAEGQETAGDGDS